jgi:hypothetical protein
MRVVHICSFSNGCYRVRSEGGQTITFEDSDQFGPSLVNMRTGDLKMLPDKSWFWRFYQPWREAGRPTTGQSMSTPNGPLETAVWVKP